MIIQVFNRVNDVRDLCEKRCEQLRNLAKPVHRPVQRVYPLSFQQNESLNLTGKTTSIVQQQINEHLSSFDMDSNVSNNELNAKMDKKQR